MKWQASGFFLDGCDTTHSVKSENNTAESILIFLKFSNTGLADPIKYGIAVVQSTTDHSMTRDLTFYFYFSEYCCIKCDYKQGIHTE